MRIRSGDSLESLPLDLLKVFLTQLSGGVFQTISFSTRRLRRLAGMNSSVSFTAEVIAGRGSEAAARLQSPEAFAATLEEVELPETVELLSVQVSEVLEAEQLEGSTDVSSADAALIAAVVFGGLVVLGISGILIICCWRQHEPSPKQAVGEGPGDAEADVPPMNLSGFFGDVDLRKSRSSNMIVSRL